MFDGNVLESECIIMERTVEKTCDCPEISYRLFRKTVFDEEWGKRESYTIVCECDGDISVLPDVTSVREKAEKIVELFAGNTVTPIGAMDVIEEMI